MKKGFFKFIPLCVMLAIMTWGCANTIASSDSGETKPAAAQAAAENVYKGKIIGKSNKAKTISIEVGKGDKAKTMMVKFDDQTKGVEHAAKGEAAIITWEKRGDDKFATVIKPKLAKLPEGVAEVKSDDVKKLIDSGADFVLIDSRPTKRYAQDHLPGAISITVEQMSSPEGIAMLPEDKDKLLVFYCGGFT